MELGASPPLADPLASGQKLRPYNPATDQATLNGNNPTRRDTTMLPAVSLSDKRVSTESLTSYHSGAGFLSPL